jgi:hypothetical protein
MVEIKSRTFDNAKKFVINTIKPQKPKNRKLDEESISQDQDEDEPEHELENEIGKMNESSIKSVEIARPDFDDAGNIEALLIN